MRKAGPAQTEVIDTQGGELAQPAAEEQDGRVGLRGERRNRIQAQNQQKELVTRRNGARFCFLSHVFALISPSLLDGLESPVCRKRCFNLQRFGPAKARRRLLGDEHGQVLAARLDRTHFISQPADGHGLAAAQDAVG